MVLKVWFFLTAGSAPLDGAGLVSREVFLVGGACACVLVHGAGPSLSEEQRSVQ